MTRLEISNFFAISSLLGQYEATNIVGPKRTLINCIMHKRIKTSLNFKNSAPKKDKI